MKNISKTWICLLMITFILNLFSGILNFAVWLGYGEPKTPEMSTDSNPYIDGTWAESIQQWTTIFSEKLDWILHLPQRDDYVTALWYALSLIRISINRILGLLALVAFIYMLYCWFLVLMSWSGDKNASKGKKWISTAAIALAWIGLSRLIVSAIIWFISMISKV